MCSLKFYTILLDKQSIVTKYFWFLLALWCFFTTKSSSSPNDNYEESILKSLSMEDGYYISDEELQEGELQSKTPRSVRRTSHHLNPIQRQPKRSHRRRTRKWSERKRRKKGQFPELNYVLTVDQDLYKRVLKEMSDHWRVCGLYYCCHEALGETKHVDIGVAISLLLVVLTLMAIATSYWPWWWLLLVRYVILLALI